MTPEIMRQYLAVHAPELEVVELPEAHTTEYISREWKVLPAQVAKTLTLRVGEDAIIVVTCGDSRPSQSFRVDQLQALAYMSFSLYRQAYSVGFIFFGFYCLLIGRLICQSTFLPRILGGTHDACWLRLVNISIISARKFSLALCRCPRHSR